MQKAKLSLIAAALLVPAFALSAYAADFVRPMPESFAASKSSVVAWYSHSCAFFANFITI